MSIIFLVIISNLSFEIKNKFIFLYQAILHFLATNFIVNSFFLFGNSKIDLW